MEKEIKNKKIKSLDLRNKTVEMLERISKKVNKKSLGSPVDNDDIISFSLGLIGENEIEKIKELSYSQEDKNKLALDILAKKMGKNPTELLSQLLKKEGNTDKY